MKCPRCLSEMKYNKCPDCGGKFTSGGTSRVDYHAPQICCVCNNTKGLGRRFKINKNSKDCKEVCYCYWCWGQYNAKHVATGDDPKFDTKEEAAYIHGLHEAYLRPGFEGKEPDWAMIEKLGRAVTQRMIDDMNKKDAAKLKLVSDKNAKTIGDMACKITKEQKKCY